MNSDFKQKLSRLIHRYLGMEARPDLRFLRFLVVGASGLVINNLALWLFTESGGIHYLISAVLATQCSTLWNFIFTETWVFAKSESRSLVGRMARFFLMNNAALLLRGPLLTLMVSALGIHYLLANLVSIFVIAVLRFVLSDRWIWTSSKGENPLDIFAYDIHSIIGVESWIRLPELEYFRVPALGRKPDIRLRQERRKVPRDSPGTIRYNEGFGPIGFELTIDRGEIIEIQVSALVRKSPHVLYTNIFEPVLRWTFVRKGYALVHGACIQFGDQAALVTAQTDTGKTSTILRVIENYQCAFISDDMTILDRNGRLFNFPKPLTISSHTLSALRHTSLGFGELLKLQIQSKIHSRSGRKFAFWLVRSGLPVASINAIVQILIPPPKYMIDRLIPEVLISDSASLSHIIEIERGPEIQEKLDHKDIVGILNRNAEDAYGFPPYPEIAGSLSTWGGENLTTLERQIVYEGVKGCRAWRLGSPSFGWWVQLPKIVKPNQAAVKKPVRDELNLSCLSTEG